MKVIEDQTNSMRNRLDTYCTFRDKDLLGKRQPLEKLGDLLDRWEDELKRKHMTHEDIYAYTEELYKTTQAFEEELRNEVNGHKLEIQFVREQY